MPIKLNNVELKKIAASAIRRGGGKIKLPDKPGVYFFYKGKEVIYVGKATSLRGRVRSYFGKDLIGTRGPVLVEMVFQADKIDWEVTDSVLEALILEASLIKKYQPKYNTKEKSDKSFNYVVISKEDLPKVYILRERELNLQREKFGSVFGPYTNGSQLKEALKILRRIFPFLDDKSKNNYRFYKQVDLVPDISTAEGIEHYKNNIRYLKLFFQGKKKDIIRGLKKEMMQNAKERKFELAGEMKRQLFALQHINDVALLKAENLKLSDGKAFRIEAYDIAHMSGKNMVGVMVVVENSNAIKSEYKKFSARGGSALGGKTILGNSKPNDTVALAEVLERRFRHTEWQYPDLVVVDGGIAQVNTAVKVLRGLRIDIPVVSVVKDERHKPKAIQGKEKLATEHKGAILLANSEAHRFAIAYHKNMRSRSFLR